MGDTIKKIGLDVLIFSLSGILCVTGSYVIIKKFMPPSMFGASSHVEATPAKGHESKPEKTKEKGGHGKEKEGEHGAEAATGEGHAYPLKPVIVNLADNSVRRFAKVTLTVIVNDERASAELQKKDPQICDALIKILNRYQYDEINSPDGKEVLKQEVKNRLNLILKEEMISDVFLTELIIQ